MPLVALVFFVTQALISILMLETVNYVEHWGLTRAGKRVSFPDAEVFDWMISDGHGGREGGYSIEALTS